MQKFQLSNNVSKKSNIRVSIIVPAYNVQNYINECMESLIAQTLKEIEIIVINDGSVDGTGSIISSYAAKDNRIKIINQNNQGLSAARNKGLLYAQGEYILFVDSDDYLEKNCVEILYQNAFHQMDIVLYGANIFTDIPNSNIYFQEKKNGIWDRTTKLNENICGIDMFCLMHKENKFVSSVVIQLFKRDFLKERDIRFTEGYIHEDFAFCFHAMIYAQNVRCIPNKLYNRRIRDDSTVTSMISVQNFKGRFKAYIDILDIISDIEIEEDKREYFESYIDLLLDNARRLFWNFSESERLKIYFKNDFRVQKIYESIFFHFDSYIPDKNGHAIWIFGAGKIGKRLIADKEGKKIIGIIDNYQVGYIDNIKIYAFSEFLKVYHGELVVIASSYFTEMRKQLIANGIFQIKIYQK